MTKRKAIADSQLLEDGPTEPIDVGAELDALAKRYRRAGGLGLQVLNLVGDSAEGLLKRLPSPVRDRLDSVTEAALTTAMRTAQGSRRIVGR